MNRITKELEHHIPFTAFGALSGIVLMFLFKDISHAAAHRLFYIFHPLHVVLSAITTTAMFRRYQCTHRGFACSIGALILIGYTGSVGIATLSDSLIPFIGEKLLRLPHPEAHLGFIEEWWIVNPAAFLGIAIAYRVRETKLPHAGHVLISTWASLFHVLMAIGTTVGPAVYIGIFSFLFLSVWLPCCISDIVFPLVFVRDGKRKR
jgi:hypothetical protein